MTWDTPWVVMWCIAFAIYTACKLLTWTTTPTQTSLVRQAGYLLAWPGMDAKAFLDAKDAVRPTRGEVAFALLKMAFGLVLIFAVLPAANDQPLHVRGVIGMAGITFTLHFGLFHVLSCFWRSIGVNAVPLMDWPIASRSLAEFWGRRWNRAFRDLTHRYVFKPLLRRLGPRGGLFAGFLVSGVVHELAITVPAGSRHGGPTLFFALQGVGLLMEKKWPRCRGRLFTLAMLLLPAGLLFPPAFLERVVLPFLAFSGATP
jgi:Membrane bound O-acyl transferase family